VTRTNDTGEKRDTYDEEFKRQSLDRNLIHNPQVATFLFHNLQTSVIFRLIEYVNGDVLIPYYVMTFGDLEWPFQASRVISAVTELLA